MTGTCDSNVHEESTWTPRILIEEERGIGTELREISKDWIWDNNVEKPTISENDLERFKCSELLVDRSRINFRSLFKAEHSLEKHRMGETNLKRITSSAYMKNLGDRKTLDKSEIKILKNKIPWMESSGTPEKNSIRGEKELYLRTFLLRAICKERAD